MADKTTSSIVIRVPRKDVMAVIADFAAYPEWATGVRGAEVLSQAGNRASTVRFTLDAGLIKDSYVLGYDWDDDARVRWNLTEAGSVVSEMSGGYELAERGDEKAHYFRPIPCPLRPRLPSAIMVNQNFAALVRCEGR